MSHELQIENEMLLAKREVDFKRAASIAGENAAAGSCEVENNNPQQTYFCSTCKLPIEQAAAHCEILSCVHHVNEFE